MNKRLALPILLRYPVSVLKNGLRAAGERWHRDRVKTRYHLERLPTISLLDLFPDLSEELSVYSFLHGTSLPTDLMLLKQLARRYKACDYLEIGSWRGESLANVADVAQSCTSVTLSDDEMRAMGFGEEFVAVHGIFSEGYPNIRVIRQNSRTLDFGTLGQKYDLIFIDGDHSYEGVRNDTRKVMPLRKGSDAVVVWHDYGFNTEEVRHSVLHGILDGLPAEAHGNLYHVSNTMCAVYLEGWQQPVSRTHFPVKPDKKFSLRIRAARL